MSDPISPPPNLEAPPSERKDWRNIAAKIISIVAVLGAVMLTLWVWSITERHPRTDDAAARANVVGIAPRVRGQIFKLNVQDNQTVAAGDVLFEIDPADYELALEKAKADLATLDRQIEVARSQDAQLKFQVKAAEAAVEQAKAELKQAGDTLQRMQPLLTNGFAKADEVDRVATAKGSCGSRSCGRRTAVESGASSIKRPGDPDCPAAWRGCSDEPGRAGTVLLQSGRAVSGPRYQISTFL